MPQSVVCIECDFSARELNPNRAECLSNALDVADLDFIFAIGKEEAVGQALVGVKVRFHNQVHHSSGYVPPSLLEISTCSHSFAIGIRIHSPMEDSPMEDHWQDVKDLCDMVEMLEKDTDPKTRQTGRIARLREDIRKMTGTFQ